MTKSDAKPGNRLPAGLKKGPTGIIDDLSGTECVLAGLDMRSKA